MQSNTPARYDGEPVREDFLNYGQQSIEDVDKKAVLEALNSDYITRGPFVREFEEKVAEFVDVDHAIATTSGTTALHLAGLTARFGPGDEVITTPLTFVSTAHAATYAGAKPVFADIDSKRRTLDPDAVRNQISENTVGLVPMHYAGYPADIEGLLEVADDHNLTVIWDACHGFGGTHQGTPLGSHRDMAVFSFHPVKNITTGEGGMIVTDDDEFAKRLRNLRSFNMEYDPKAHENEPWYQVVDGIGYNYNITDIQAALGLSQLDRLESLKQRRDEIIRLYNEKFSSISGLRTPPKRADVDPFYHLYVLEIRENFGCSRREFVNAMHDENIGVQVHYVPLHYHPFFQEEYGYERGDFPITEQVYNRLVSLPLFPEMTDGDANDVIRAVERLHEYHSE